MNPSLVGGALWRALAFARRLARLGSRAQALLRLRRLPDPDAGGPILFVGDSIAQLWGVEDPRLFADNGFVNAGRGGLTTANLVRTFGEEVLRERPRCVHVICGINDIAENEGHVPPRIVARNLRAVVRTCRWLQIDVFVASVLPVTSVPWRPGWDPRDRIAVTNALIRRMCRRQDIPFVDYHAGMAAADGRLPGELTTDGLHLSPSGYSRLRSLLADGLRHGDRAARFGPYRIKGR